MGRGDGMNKEMRFIYIVSLVMAMAFSLILGSGCGGQYEAAPDGSVAVLSDVGTCKSFSTTKGPGQLTDTFSRTDRWITCAAKLSDAPRSTKVKAIWYHDHRQIYTQTISTHGTRWLGLTLKLEDLDLVRFREGDYSIKFFLNGEEHTTQSFRVE